MGEAAKVQQESNLLQQINITLDSTPEAETEEVDNVDQAAEGDVEEITPTEEAQQQSRSRKQEIGWYPPCLHSQRREFE